MSPHTSIIQNPVPSVLPEGDDLAEIVAELPPLPQYHLANATLFMLARNSEVDNAVSSVRELEDRFNHKYGYPWVFLNEQEFSDEFKRCALNSHFLRLFL